MADIATIQNTARQLYDELIQKVIRREPLNDRESTAYYALDFYIRLEMGAYDGIWQKPQPFIDALVRLGFMSQARKLTHAVRLGPDRLDWDQPALRACEAEIGEIARDLDNDVSMYERAVFEFWQQTSD